MRPIMPYMGHFEITLFEFIDSVHLQRIGLFLLGFTVLNVNHIELNKQSNKKALEHEQI